MGDNDNVRSFPPLRKRRIAGLNQDKRIKKGRMKKTFVCDESMIITIPIGSLKDAREGQLMPESFQCVYRDAFKVFVVKGKPKPLGAAQVITGVFILTLSLISIHTEESILFYIPPSVWFVISGLLSYAAGQYPNMHVTKLCFFMNIISFFWSVVAICLCAIWFHVVTGYSWQNNQIHRGVKALIMTLLVVEKLIALFLIYWLSKAVCRQHFSTLPIILLKLRD